MAILSVNRDAKTVKGLKQGYLTGIQYLAPGREAGGRNLCPMASKGCLGACLFTAGHAGVFKSINEARIAKTQRMFADPAAYRVDLCADICKLRRKAEREGLQAVVRPNGTTDVRWELDPWGIPQEFPETQFYDYSKWQLKRRLRLPNYHLTFSLSERPKSWEWAREYLHEGLSCAVVFRSSELVKQACAEGFRGWPVVDGDTHDARFHFKGGHIVALTAKGRAKKDTTGFVLDTLR